MRTDPAPTAPLVASPPIDQPPLRAAEEDELDQQLARFEGLVPPPIGKLLAYTQRPGSLHYRLPIALLFLVGGCGGFLPILGFWMIPFGLMLVVQDIRPLRPTMARCLSFVNGTLERHRGARPRTRPRLCAMERSAAACVLVRANDGPARTAGEPR